jgi:hypothetical protein
MHIHVCFTDANGDNSIRHMFVWGDDCPDIDLKCYILILVYTLKWQGGYLFPSQAEVAAKPADGIYKTFVEEPDLYKQLKEWYQNIMGRIDKLLCHCTRKTAYLWDYLRGQIDLNMLRLQAGHDHAHTADQYISEEPALAHIIAQRNDATQKLGKYYPILSNGCENSRRVNLPCQHWQKPLPELARGFIEDVVGIDPNHPEACSIQYLYKKVTEWQAPGNNPQQTMKVSILTCNNMHK